MQGTTVFPLCHPHSLVNSNSLAQTNYKKISKLLSSKAAKRKRGAVKAIMTNHNTRVRLEQLQHKALSNVTQHWTNKDQALGGQTRFTLI